MKGFLHFIFNIIIRYHLLVCSIIVLTVIVALPGQIQDRATFANTELYQDVLDRWGAPIVQSAPSVRYIESGTVFTELKALTFSSQTVSIDALMNYRKRGLVYFSGFDFDFEGTYTVENSKATKIDIVFVFPVNLEKNKILLSNFNFSINNEPAQINLSETKDKLIWTGRLEQGQIATFFISYSGRGLDEFLYILDPDLPVKDFLLIANITGGLNYDYSEGVIPATDVDADQEGPISLTWDYASLESGVPVGLTLPAEKSYDEIIVTMTCRSWLTFLFFFAGLVSLFICFKKKFSIYTACLITASYAFFFVLLAYLAAYLSFYPAYCISLLVIALMLFLYLLLTISLRAAFITVGLFIIYQLIPTLAIILEGYTGLIYTLEILGGLCLMMWLSSRRVIQRTITTLYTTIKTAEEIK